MKERHKEFVAENLDINREKTEVWNIPDADPEDDLEPIFKDIEKKIDEMF